MKPTIKYTRVEDKKLIVVPTKEGLDILKERLRIELSKDEIAGKEVAAFVIEFKSTIVFFKEEVDKTHNNHHMVRTFTEAKEAFSFKIPATVA